MWEKFGVEDLERQYGRSNTSEKGSQMGSD
uniref:Uncharacterized protein n=1 Tax=Nelumbo nucifera TaxID=4432 RepID=A0A822YDZ7_NELNU|nr:TPA_asm: hypothetical protein HUJ06_011245 [Nelumbo nucifera]